MFSLKVWKMFWTWKMVDCLLLWLFCWCGAGTVFFLGMWVCGSILYEAPGARDALFFLCPMTMIVLFFSGFIPLDAMCRRFGRISAAFARLQAEGEAEEARRWDAYVRGRGGP